ncbi:MAG: N-formylglutamate deformylase [Rhodanobacter sp.]
MDTFTLQRGRVPLLISLPHDGSFIPDDIAACMRPAARRSPDTDWHVGRLYQPLAEALGASVLKPLASRYVIDLNRPADGHALYPGQRETGLVSTIGFDGEPLYLEGVLPDAEEVQQRINEYWKPYHQAISQELARLCVEHGRAVLWEGHSIRSRVPMLFDGQLPDFNLGTASGASCAEPLQVQLQACLESQSRFSFAVNGRFKGGYITRHFGAPAAGVQAVQLELAQHNYMDEESFGYDEVRAVAVQKLIERLLSISLALSQNIASEASAKGSQ